jgi:hypothetical protein
MYVGIMEVVTVLGPTHILRQVLMSKGRLFNCEITLSVPSRTAATLYNLETWFVSGV